MSRLRPDPDARIALPITPMLDMTFQLLFFFVMNFNPADLEGQMHMSLPAEVVGGVGGDRIAKGGEVVPPFPNDLTVEVRARRADGGDGGISAIFVRKLDGMAVRVDGIDGLEKYLATRRVGFEDAIAIRGDSHLHIQHLVKVMDVCKAAGYTKTSLISPEDSGR